MIYPFIFHLVGVLLIGFLSTVVFADSPGNYSKSQLLSDMNRVRDFLDLDCFIPLPDSSASISSIGVTQGLWHAVMKNNPSYFREYRFCPESHAVVDGVEMCLDYPVESVTYVNLGKKSSVQEFLRELNRLFESEGKFYFRVESVEEFNWAVSFLPIEDNPDLGKYFSYREISDQDPIANERQLPSKMPQTHAVRGKLPINGFYRTNLWEWTVDQRGALSRLLIGGSWYDPKSSTLGGNPYEKFSTDTDSSIGFRLVKVPIFF